MHHNGSAAMNRDDELMRKRGHICEISGEKKNNHGNAERTNLIADCRNMRSKLLYPNSNSCTVLSVSHDWKCEWLPAAEI